MKSNREKKKDWDKKILFYMLAVFLVILAVLFLFYQKASESMGAASRSGETYDAHYVLISEDESDPLWEDIHKGARETGREGNRAYVEYLRKNLEQQYTVEQQLQIAIASGVDGIIVDGSDAEEEVELIHEAVEKGIPVVTALNDSALSARQCFVGVSNYDLGKQYGEKALEILREKKEAVRVCVLMDTGSMDTAKNTAFLGIKETIEAENLDREIEIRAVGVQGDNAFASEETIRNLIINKKGLPDIVICLSARDTICAYQALVDYYKVGMVEILGYHDSMEILEAVEKNIIYSTLVVDGEEIGRLCVESLEEFRETGYTNGYSTVDVACVDKENAKIWIQQEEEVETP